MGSEITTTTPALTSANTEYALVLPHRATNIRPRLASATNVWRYSSVTGQVAGGGGCPVAAAIVVLFTGPVQRGGQTIYVSGANASQTLTVSYETPTFPE